jgi:DNA-binding SARP family transcriptional activator
MTMTFHFYLLGELRIVHNGEQVPPPPYRTRGFLAALLLHPRPQRRGRLGGLFFPDVPERAGRRQLSDHLWLLRRALPELPLEVSAQAVYLPPKARWLDVESFRQATAQPDLPDWLEALALYQGILLEGVHDDWLLAEREALYLQYVRLSHRTCDELLRRGRFEETLPLVERLVQAEPYDEKALRTLMRAYRALGRRGAALAAYERFLALAADELGIEPDPATRALAEAIRVATIRRPGSHVRLGPAPLPSDGSPAALLRHARQALARGDRVTVEDVLQRLRAHPDCCQDVVCLLEVDLALSFEEYDSAARLLEACDPQRAPVLVRTAELALERRQVAAAHDAASQALILANETQDRQSELEALLVLAEAQRKMGQVVQAARSEKQALDVARACAFPHGVARALVLQGYRQIRQGRLAEALAPLHEARSLAHEHGYRRILAQALRGISMAQSYSGAPLDALIATQEELSIWRDLGLLRREASTLHNLSVAQGHLGRIADCLRTLEQARQVCEQLGEPVPLAINGYHLADTLLCHDEALAPRAAAIIQEALAVFQAHNQPGWEAAALVILGCARWIEQEHGVALDAFRQAYTLYERLGELAFLPELLAYQGLAHLGLGQRDHALDLTRRALLSMTQGEVSEGAVSDVYYAHAMALAVDGRESQSRTYFTRAYQNLLAGAAQLEDEAARQAFFHRSPTTRRLMQEVYARGIAPAPPSGVISQRLPASRGKRSVQVAWTVDAGPADTALRQAQGAIALRRARLSRLIQEAQAQGAVPIVAQLAEALGVSKRTVQRDLAALRE